MLHCIRRLLLALLERPPELGIRRVVMEYRNHHPDLDSRDDLPFSLRAYFLRIEEQTRVSRVEGVVSLLRLVISRSQDT